MPPEECLPSGLHLLIRLNSGMAILSTYSFIFVSLRQTISKFYIYVTKIPELIFDFKAQTLRARIFRHIDLLLNGLA